MITFDQAVESARDFVEEFPLRNEEREQRVLLHAVTNWMHAHGASSADIDAFIQLKVDAQHTTFWKGWEEGREVVLQRTA